MARRTQPTLPSVERSIYFYRMDFGVKQSGEPVDGDLIPALQHIERLAWTSAGRYLDLGEDNVSCCWVDALRPQPRIRLGTSRRSSLPLREQAGQLSAVPMAPNQGLVEQIHIILFPNNIVGAEFNFYGPRVSRLGDYLARKARGICPSVSFLPLIRRDVSQKLERIGDIRLFQLKIHSAFSETVRDIDTSLGDAFTAARQAGGQARAGGDHELEITLKTKPYDRQDVLDQHLLRTARELAERSDLRENATKFFVGGLAAATQKVEVIDLLKDQLITKKQILKQNKRTRALLDSSAYDAIEDAHADLRQELAVAAALSR